MLLYYCLHQLFYWLGVKKTGCTDLNSPNFDATATKDNGSCEPEIIISLAMEVEHSGVISSNEFWSSEQVHTIVGNVVVQSGVTLTIQSGTIIKGSEGTGTLASALIVERGGMINAQGTALRPIIFTSELDNIQIGQLSGTNLDENDNGLWGGIILLGSAPISALDGDTDTQIEGLPIVQTYLQYGGTDASDNSGIFSYVSIRHSGALIGAGNEINGLTLGGVGSGTQIDHVEIVASQDDGLQIFGGTVNVSDIAVGFLGDDGLETEMNFDGSISNALVITGIDGDKGIDMQGPSGITYVNGTASLSDVTIMNSEGGSVRSNFTNDIKATINNVDFNGDILVRASYENDCVTPLPNALNNLIGSTPSLSFTNCTRGAILISQSSLNCTIPASDQTAAQSAFSNSSSTIGADLSVFNNWTWLSVNGKI